MILEKDSRVLISHRRLFTEDHPRFFLGIVEEYEAGLALVNGYSWQIELTRGELTRNSNARKKVISLTSGTLIVYKLPDDLDIESLVLENHQQHIILTDHAGFEMDLTYRSSIA
ncbi:MAG: hypothetical protein KDI30_12735 [Pseudomonadales bacterium]|nr:hypothetical protein [Pseudomonadales bacterium]